MAEKNPWSSSSFSVRVDTTAAARGTGSGRERNLEDFQINRSLARVELRREGRDVVGVVGTEQGTEYRTD